MRLLQTFPNSYELFNLHSKKERKLKRHRVNKIRQWIFISPSFAYCAMKSFVKRIKFHGNP